MIHRSIPPQGLSEPDSADYRQAPYFVQFALECTAAAKAAPTPLLAPTGSAAARERLEARAVTWLDNAEALRRLHGGRVRHCDPSYLNKNPHLPTRHGRPVEALPRGVTLDACFLARIDLDNFSVRLLTVIDSDNTMNLLA